MTTIKVDKDIITLINVFTVDPSRQQQLVDALIETTRQDKYGVYKMDSFQQVFIRVRIERR